jgi:hypothetical protein
MLYAGGDYTRKPANVAYYKFVGAHWGDYVLHGTAKIKRSSGPAKIKQSQHMPTL